MSNMGTCTVRVEISQMRMKAHSAQKLRHMCRIFSVVICRRVYHKTECGHGVKGTILKNTFNTIEMLKVIRDLGRL